MVVGQSAKWLHGFLTRSDHKRMNRSSRIFFLSYTSSPFGLSSPQSAQGVVFGALRPVMFRKAVFPVAYRLSNLHKQPQCETFPFFCHEARGVNLFLL